MMPPANLARFLKEEAPRLRKDHTWSAEHGFGVSLEILRLLSALDAAVGLLREAAQKLGHEWWLAHKDRCLHESGLCTGATCQFHPQPQILATLRLVLGEKETNDVCGGG